MADYGLTPQGFNRPSFQTIREEIATDYREELGPDAVVQGGKWGRLVDKQADRLDKVWKAMEGVHAARTRRGAQGVALDDVGSLTGTPREGPKKSLVRLKISGTPGTQVPVGFTVKPKSTAARFKTAAAATIGAPGYVDDVLAESEDYGPVAAQAGTLTEIVTTFAGVTAVTNPEDVELGALEEEDVPYRLRQEAEIRGPGRSAPDAIRAKLLRVGEGTNNPVVSCKVFENTSMAVDSAGMPPKSIEAVVQGGEDADVALELWRSKPGGIYTHGTILVTVKDAAGENQPVRFSRPEEVPVYVAVTVKKGPKWPTSLADSNALVLRIQKSVAAYDADLVLGEGVVHNFLFDNVRVEGRDVIAGVPALFVGTAPSPSGTADIQVGSRQRADLDTSRVVVTLV